MAELTLGTKREDNKTITETFNVECTHSTSSGYSIVVSKNFIEKRDDSAWSSRIFLPFANGNFRFRVSTGRKSQKKLDKANAVITENMETYLNLWKEDKHQELANLIRDNLIISKVF